MTEQRMRDCVHALTGAVGAFAKNLLASPH